MLWLFFPPASQMTVIPSMPSSLYQHAVGAKSCTSGLPRTIGLDAKLNEPAGVLGRLPAARGGGFFAADLTSGKRCAVRSVGEAGEDRPLFFCPAGGLSARGLGIEIGAAGAEAAAGAGVAGVEGAVTTAPGACRCFILAILLTCRSTTHHACRMQISSNALNAVSMQQMVTRSSPLKRSPGGLSAPRCRLA